MKHIKHFYRRTVLTFDVVFIFTNAKRPWPWQARVELNIDSS